MKLGRHTERKRPGMKAVELIGREQPPTPIFSAQQALESQAEALRGDQKVTARGRSTDASFQAKLAVLAPDHATYILDQAAEPFPKQINDLRGQGHNLLLFVHQFPQVVDFLKSAYTANELKQQVAASFKPGIRPTVWPKLLGKLLFPEAGDWELKEEEKTYMFIWIQGLMKREPSWEDESKAISAAADLVLLDPSIKLTIQTMFQSTLSAFGREVDHIFGNSNNIVDVAFDLEIIFGDTISVDETGQLQIKGRSVSSARPLPERPLT